MSKLRPNFTPMPNFFYDDIIPYLKPDEVQILCYAVRRIFGFKQCRERGRDRISLTQFQEGTLLSRPKASRAINALLDYGILIDHSRGRVSKQGRLIGLQDDDQKVNLEAIYAQYEKLTKRRVTRAQNFRPTGTNMVPNECSDEDLAGTNMVPITGTETVPITGTNMVPVSIEEKKKGKETKKESEARQLSIGRVEAINVCSDQFDGDMHQAMKVWMLAIAFEGFTGLDRPGFDEIDDRRLTDRELREWTNDWVKPLAKMVELLGDEVNEVLEAAVAHFRDNNISYSKPGSFLKTIKRWAKDRSLGYQINGNGNGQHAPEPAPVMSGGKIYTPSSEGVTQWGA